MPGCQKHDWLRELLSTLTPLSCPSAPVHVCQISKIKFKNSHVIWDYPHRNKNKVLCVSNGGRRTISTNWTDRKCFSHKQHAYLRRMTPLSGKIESLSCGSRRGKRSKSPAGHAWLPLKGQRLRWRWVHSWSDHLLEPDAAWLTNQPTEVECRGQVTATISSCIRPLM